MLRRAREATILSRNRSPPPPRQQYPAWRRGSRTAGLRTTIACIVIAVLLVVYLLAHVAPRRRHHGVGWATDLIEPLDLETARIPSQWANRVGSSESVHLNQSITTGVPVLLYAVLTLDTLHETALRETRRRLDAAHHCACHDQRLCIQPFPRAAAFLCTRGFAVTHVSFDGSTSRLLQLGAKVDEWRGNSSDTRPLLIAAVTLDDGPSLDPSDILDALDSALGPAAATAQAVVGVSDCTTRGPGRVVRASPFSGGELAVKWGAGVEQGGATSLGYSVPSAACLVLPSRRLPFAALLKPDRINSVLDLVGPQTDLLWLEQELRRSQRVEASVYEASAKCAVELSGHLVDVFRSAGRTALGEMLHRRFQVLSKDLKAGLNVTAEPPIVDSSVAEPAGSFARIHTLCHELQSTAFRSPEAASFAVRRSHARQRTTAIIRQALRVELRRLVTASTERLQKLLDHCQRTALGFEPAFVFGFMNALQRGAVTLAARRTRNQLTASTSSLARVAGSLPAPRRVIAWSTFCCACCGFSEEVAAMATSLDRRLMDATVQHELSQDQNRSGWASGSVAQPRRPWVASTVVLTNSPQCFCPSGLLGDVARMSVDEPGLEDGLLAALAAVNATQASPVDSLPELVWIAHSTPETLHDITWLVANRSMLRRSVKSYQDSPEARMLRLLPRPTWIARAMTEVSDISIATAQRLKEYADVVWAPSTFVADVFRRAGVPRVEVVPEPVDTQLYRPKANATDTFECGAFDMSSVDIKKWFTMSHPTGETASSIFTLSRMGHDSKLAQRCCEAADAAACAIVLTQFKWEPRKGWDVLLRAAVKAARRQAAPRRMVLVALTRWFNYNTPNYTNPQHATRIFGQLTEHIRARNITVPDNLDIMVIAAQLPDVQIAAAARCAQVFALPTRGEGWGLPAVQAMASGTPVLVTNATGPADFADGCDAIRVCAAVPLKGWFEGYAFNAGPKATLVEPCEDHLAERLAWHLDRVHGAERRRVAGAHARAVAVQRYSTDVIAVATEAAIERAVALTRSWQLTPPN
jgi:glycosyltransferase involved in cell wall biosynthesis